MMLMYMLLTGAMRQNHCIEHVTEWKRGNLILTENMRTLTESGKRREGRIRLMPQTALRKLPLVFKFTLKPDHLTQMPNFRVLVQN